MLQLVECVPNFSEGRRLEVIEAVANAVRQVPGCYVLNVSSDPDHNRTVVTFVGSPITVAEGAFQLIKEAAKYIDLDHHTGEHPRLGATDVVPFIPVRDVTMADCVQIARKVGRRVGDELGIPVYLYADAATRPDRVRLPDIRKGQYEVWKEEVATEPARLPDYGPAKATPAGATVIGARPFLVAYNIYLNSDNAEIADRIAKDIRFIGGGLRFVQAKGFLVDGMAQVSMNLTDFTKTPIHRVQEMVRREAANYGLNIVKAELVGMIPQKALTDAARSYLQLHELTDDMILEHKLAAQLEAESTEADLTPTSFLDATASGSPTPGGGSAAAFVGALAASLTTMVGNLTLGRQKYADVQVEVEQILSRTATLKTRLTAAVQEDAEAFNRLMAAYRLKDVEPEEKNLRVQQATISAADVPLQVARLCREVAQLALQIARIGNINATSDAAASGLLARAAMQTAALNVRINGANLDAPELVQSWRDELEQLEAEVTHLADEVVKVATERGGY
ncbi:MAG: glutamate formimidoyltransferase [Anaerolineales bacterium]|nr:glutamate formimidoyltransferase [Anaerolineales bacterium]